MKNVLIHCAMQKESCKIAEKLNLKLHDSSLLKLYKGNNITLLETGIGKQKTAIGLVKYLENYEKPDIIINIGYVGSNNTKIGTWVNVSKVYNWEWEIIEEEKYSMDIGNQELININELESLPCYSAESFITKTEIKESVVFDMELHSVALVADIYKIPLLSLKLVTDNLSMDDYYKSIESNKVIDLVEVTKYIDKYVRGA